MVQFVSGMKSCWVEPWNVSRLRRPLPLQEGRQVQRAATGSNTCMIQVLVIRLIHVIVIIIISNSNTTKITVISVVLRGTHTVTCHMSPTGTTSESFSRAESKYRENYKILVSLVAASLGFILSLGILRVACAQSAYCILYGEW